MRIILAKVLLNVLKSHDYFLKNIKNMEKEDYQRTKHDNNADNIFIVVVNFPTGD